MPANSYNEIFGLGSHSGLVGPWYQLQETTRPLESTPVVDSSPLGLDATMPGFEIGGASINRTGPTSYLPSALDFGSVDNEDRVVLPKATFRGLDTVSLGFWALVDDTSRDHSFFNISAFAANEQATLIWFDQNESSVNTPTQFRTISFLTSSSARTAVAATGVMAQGQWHHIGLTYQRNVAGGMEIYVDGVLRATVSVTPTLPFDNSGASVEPRLGNNQNTNGNKDLDGGMAGFFGTPNVALDASEFAEVYAGPEPLQTVAGSLTSDGTELTIDPGTWDSQSNGTVTNPWDIHRASDDTIIHSGVGAATYLPPENGGFYAVIRGSNDGGVDPAETQTTSIATVSPSPVSRSWYARPRTRVLMGGI